MGTNYYRKPILTKERKQRLHDLIEQKKFYSDYDEENDPESSVTNMIGWLDKGVHICKMSCGWYTCFDHNWGKYYQPNRKSLEEFLSEPGYEIVDENNEKYTPEEFWEKVDTRDACTKRDGTPLWDMAGYEEWEMQQNPNYIPYHCYDDRNKVRTTFGIECDSDDFKVDNLRFAVFSDFS